MWLCEVDAAGSQTVRTSCLPERQLRSVLFADVTLVSAEDHIERVAGASGSIKALGLHKLAALAP